MNPLDQVQQIVEAVKTWNVNVNDATLQKIAEVLLPAVKYIIAYKVFHAVWVGLAVAGCIAMLFYFIWRMSIKFGNPNE